MLTVRDDYLVQSITGAFRFLVSDDVSFRTPIRKHLLHFGSHRFYLLRAMSNKLVKLYRLTDTTFHAKWWTSVRVSVSRLRSLFKIRVIFDIDEANANLRISNVDSKVFLFTKDNHNLICQNLHEQISLIYFKNWLGLI